MATKKKAVKARKVVNAADRMKKYPAPKWAGGMSEDINRMAELGGYVATDADRELRERTRICFEGIRVVTSEDKDYLVRDIWYRGYRLSVVVGRKKKATKANHGLAVSYILQRNWDKIPIRYANEVDYLFEDANQKMFCAQADAALRSNNISI